MWWKPEEDRPEEEDSCDSDSCFSDMPAASERRDLVLWNVNHESTLYSYQQLIKWIRLPDSSASDIAPVHTSRFMIKHKETKPDHTGEDCPVKSSPPKTCAQRAARPTSAAIPGIAEQKRTGDGDVKFQLIPNVQQGYFD